MVKYWINNISRNTEAVFLKLGTTIVYDKRNEMSVLFIFVWKINKPITYLTINNKVNLPISVHSVSRMQIEATRV